MAGVIRRRGAHAQYHVVGGAFASLQELAPCHPRQRIPPIQTQGGARQQVGGVIAAPHVSQFVQQHHAAALRAPIRRIGRHKNRRTEEAERYRHAARAGFQHVHFTSDPERRHERREFRVAEWLGCAPDAPHDSPAREHLRRRGGEARGPEQH